MANVQLAVAGDDNTQVILSVPGVQGPAGSNLPASGTTNQILFKQSNTDYDTAWSFVTNAMVASGAAIAGTKISPNFGSQNVVTTGTSTAASFIPTSSSVPTNGVYLPSANNVAISTSGTQRVNFGTGEVVFNETGENYDFRIEGDTEPNLVFVDASTNRVGLGTSSPNSPLEVGFGGINFDGAIAALPSSGADFAAFIARTASTGTAPFDQAGSIIYRPRVSSTAGRSSHIFYTGSPSAIRMVINETGNVGIGTTAPSDALQVASGNILIGTGGSSAGYRALYFGSSVTASARFAYIEKNNDSPFDFNIVAQSSTTASSVINFKTTPTSTAATIDSSGRLLVGTSSSTSNATAILQGRSDNATEAAVLRIARGLNNPADGSSLATIAFTDSGHTNAALIFAARDGGTWTSGSSQPTRLVFSVTADGAASPTEAFRITNDRVRAYNQSAPAAVNATATLTVANLKTGIITSTSAAATDMTLPTGTDTEGGFSGIYTNMTFEWSVINTGPSLVTVLANTAHTLVGSGAVATGTSARFASRRSGANTFVTYRLS